ncbi:hypothetical protein AWA2045_17250 [Lactiplantibacillus plantarum]|nr:hypothetical protein AWA2045_17250 [Lactiplantibacillus plantarum]
MPMAKLRLIHGNNVMRLLEPGAEVLNASETKMLGLTHFSKGGGVFGDILNSVTSGISGVTSWVGKRSQWTQEVLQDSREHYYSPG